MPEIQLKEHLVEHSVFLKLKAIFFLLNTFSPADGSFTKLYRLYLELKYSFTHLVFCVASSQEAD